MKDILILLPPSPFEKEDFNNALMAIEKELKSNKLFLYCNELDEEYYIKNYNYFKISVLIHKNESKNSINEHIISRVYKDTLSYEKYIFVILKNINHEQTVQFNLTTNINIYRWQVLNNRICSIKEEILEEEDPEINSNIFSKIHNKQKSLFGLIPYGFTFRHPGYGYVNELGFRVPKDYHSLKTRDKNHKLICFFGGSCCYSMRVREDETFTFLLEKKLNDYASEHKLKTKYTVLNFGMMGYVLLNELITYILYAEDLNPDIVIGYHLLNDLQCGMSNDNLLLKKFNIAYNHRYEEWSKILHGSNEKLAWSESTTMHNKKNSPKDIIMAYYNREKQFKKIVTNNNSKYISIVQPMFFSKQELSQREQTGYNYYTNKVVHKEYTFIQNMYVKYLDYLKSQNEYEDILDLHTIFNQYDKTHTLFCDSAHTLSKGDYEISQHIFDFLNTKGFL